MYQNTLLQPYKPPAPGEDIVISGIAGRYPESRNVEEFKHNLLNKVDVITSNYDRWKIDHSEIPRDGGKVSDITKFDATFFGVHFKQAHTLDPMCRMLMEHAYEAVLDAGINPKHLRGTNTGVVVGACNSEAEKTWFYDKLQANGFGLTGCSRAMLANRISYCMGLHGPSYAVDSACSSSMVAMDNAFRMIRSGLCDRVIVGGTNLCLHPYITLQFARLGVLSPDCRCKSFDDKANGYVRSEAICAIVLEKACLAKRIYATVCYTRQNCDGYKEQGITYPASEIQTKLLEAFYGECKISPTCLSYLEAHGTGTAVGDPEELAAISNVFIDGRTTPLKIGSVKSNIGHTEPASGLCSITKVIIGMETGLIPPNMHFNSPLKGNKNMDEGRFQVITEPTPWEGGYVGINSFGFGGANVHILLKSHTKEKVNNGAPNDDLPRLVAVSGRSEEAVATMLDSVEDKPVDVEYIRLLHNVYGENINGYFFKGYTIAGPKTENPIREIQEFSDEARPIWFVFSGMGSQWAGMGEALLRFPIFNKAIQQCDAVLKPHGIDIVDVITNKDKKTFDNILNSFIGIAAIQIGLVDLLTSVGIVPDNIIGHSVGELGCAYADGCFTAKQMILAAYSRGLASIETELIHGSMAAVGLGYEQVKDLCPPDIDVACHNGPDSCTISGPAESMKEFVEQLQANKIFAKEVPCSNIAYHSRYIACAGPKLLAYLKKVIPNPKLRSSKWLSTSVPRNEWSKPSAKLCSAEYHTNNLLSSVLFAETASLIPENAVTIEIAPHGLLQAILKRSLHPDVTNVALAHRNHKDNVKFFLRSLGKLYNVGLEPQLANIYPAVEFPVSRGTPMIAPHVRWQHSDDWFLPAYSVQQKIATGERTIQVELKDENFEYMAHHVIDGRNLLPATGYLVLVWETLAMMHGKTYGDMSVVFEHIKFERATSMPKEGSVNLTIMIQKGTGKFEIVESNAAIVSGMIRIMSNPAENKIPAEFMKEFDDEEPLDSQDIYKELRLRGYQYTGPFCGLKRASITGNKGHIAWINNWAIFMDNMLQLHILSADTRGLFVPTSILRITIDTKVHNDLIHSMDEKNKEFPVYKYTDLNVLSSGGIEIRELNASAIFRRKQLATPVLEEYKFVANRDNAEISISDMITLSTNLALEDRPMINPKILEYVTDDDAVATEELLSPVFLRVLGDFPMIQPSVTLVAKSESYDSESLPSGMTMTEPQQLQEKGSIYIAAGYDILTKRKTNVIDWLLIALTNDGFLLTREDVVNEKTFLYARTCGLNVILEKRFKNKSLLLLKKEKKSPLRTEVVYLDNYKYDWLEKVQAVLKDDKMNSENARLVLVAEGDLENGALGLAKCLSKEPNGQIVRSVIIQDKNAPKFSLDNPLYAKQLELNNSFNVLRPGNVWGTYRHLPLPPPQQRPVFHGYANQTVRGDLNSIKWMDGPIPPGTSDDSIVYIAYGSLNFRDVMLATGKLPAEAIAKTREMQECLIGFEYSGVTATGRRVFGIVESRALSNVCVTMPLLQWDVPDYLTLEDAATMPVVYATAYSALYVSGKMQKGEKVLIHAGSGGLGQAAIHLALHEGCEVFTTVGTPEKRKFIRETFPSIDDDHIGNSRNTSFEQMIRERTNGKGVDIVLNSLAEEKLQASLRCLGIRGRFLEVGKFDISADNQIGLRNFGKELSFHCVMLDNVMCGNAIVQKHLQFLVSEIFKWKSVKPLVRKCFKKDEVEAAFRYMAAGKHIGKVLIKIHEDNEPLDKPILAYPYFYALPSKNYVIIGGLGGCGLEIADWLVLRGAKNLTLVSRNGIRTGYQRMRTELWKSYGVKVLIISGVDASKTDGCEFILKTAEKQAPVDGIFNLAALLRDALCVNQTVENFEESLKPKMWITKKLDEVSRKICPQLRHFVVFSSISCGRGNIGQTNYGLGNAVMERICERRVSEGLPGLAIQWGAVGDVGLAAEMLGTNEQLDIAGTLQQRITSCLEVFDQFLMQNRPIVSSMIVAEKRAAGSGANTVIEAVMNIMSMKDLKGVSQTSTLAEIGMDSMMAVEIKQTLERDFDINLTAQDIRNLNIGKLIKMSAKGNDKTNQTNEKPKTQTEHVFGMKLLLRTIDAKMLTKEICMDFGGKLKTKKSGAFLIPGIEGIASIFSTLTSKLPIPATCFQLGITDANLDIEDMADVILPHALEKNKGRINFTILGYSYGSLITIELARRLEAHGLVGRLILVDGSPDYMKALRREHMAGSDEEECQIKLLVEIMSSLMHSVPSDLVLELSKCDTWEKKLDKFITYGNAELLELYSYDVQKAICTVIYNRMCSIEKYNCSSLPRIKSPITLLKPTLTAARMPTEDYGLSQVTHGKVDVYELEGNHHTILDHEKLVTAILGDPLDDKESFKTSLYQVDEPEIICSEQQ